MENEYLRRKYVNLKYRLYSISQKLDTLEDIYSDLNRDLKEGILVDGQNPVSDELSGVNTSIRGIKNEINGTLFYSINSKIY